MDQACISVIRAGCTPCNTPPIANPGNGNGGGQGQNLCQDPPCREEIFKDLVTGQVIYPANQAEHEWRGKYFAYRSFRDDPSWLTLGTADDTLFQNFYAASDTSNIGNIVRIEELVEDDSITTAISINASMAPGNLIESNQKRLNEIYLSTWAMLVDTFTAVEEQDLIAIAYQCPTTGGNAVFGARVMLGLDILDSCLMGMANRYLSSDSGNLFGRITHVKIFPNPSTGRFIIEFDPGIGYVSACIVRDIAGRTVFQVIVPHDTFQIEIDLKHFPDGVFLVELVDAKGVVSRTKAVVMK